MLAYLKLIRPLNGIMAVTAAWIGMLAAGAAIYPGTTALLASLSVFLISSAGMAINDYYDSEIDKINKPKRPIPSGRISRKAALWFSIALFIAGIANAYMVSLPALAIAALASLLLVLYAAKLKKTLLLGHVVISLLVGLTFVFGGVAAGNHVPTLLMAFLAFLSNNAREVYKSIEDIMGDKQHAVNSLPVKIGVLKAKLIANAFVIAAVIFSFVPFLLGFFGQAYLFLAVVADIGFVSTVITPVRYSARICKLSMLVALAAFLAGAIRF